MADRTPEASPPKLAGPAGIESPAELTGRIDKLQAAADDAAGQVRNLYVAFLSFGLYLAITVGATTDEQLLRESPVRLPIVDVGLPLVAFYWIAPFLFVLFHFNLLMQLYLLSEKLHRLDASIRRLPDDAQRERRATLSQFVFSQMLIGQHGQHGRSRIRLLLNVIAWTTFVVLPIAVLLLTQIQFLPYHDPFTTWWQRCLILLDLLLLWLLWLPAIEPTGRLSRAQPFYWRAWPVFGLLSLSAVSLLIALLVATIPGEFLAGPIDRLIAERGNLGVLNRNLSLREKQLVLQLPEPGLIENIGEEKALAKYTRGLDLRGRDLRYADLQFADLRKADLREGVRLQGAVLWGADLRGADLTGAELQGADLPFADLQGAGLRDAELQGANLAQADLLGADLQVANLQGAHLKGADLRGADLRVANLQGAHLWGAKLQGADLERAELQGAGLAVANLQGADLVGADLQGAGLRDAKLQGADLKGADLRGADLGVAYLWGANLEGADLRGADLKGADLWGADLAGAELQGADLAGADLQGTDLRNAHLWRAKIGAEPDRDDLWDLADLRGAGIDPVDADALIADVEANITDEQTRNDVVARLEASLGDGMNLPELPSWQAQPTVMFSPDDPIADALDWAAPSMSDRDYDEKLATFLGELVCRYTSLALAQGIAVRALSERDRLLSLRFAQRLTPDDPEACPAAAELPEELRSRLKWLAARPEPPPADQPEPSPSPPDTPSQEPDTPSGKPQTSQHAE